MHVRKVLSFALVGAALGIASQARAALNPADHTQWVEDSQTLGGTTTVPAGAVEYAVDTFGFGGTVYVNFDGRIISNAAVTTNTIDSSPLNSINTKLFNGVDANLYKIQITDPSIFSASVTSSTIVLALFDSSGQGVAASTGAMAITGANAGLSAPGIYYIGLANAGGYPQNAAGQNIFGLTGSAGLYLPVTADKTLSSDPFTAWTNPGTGAPYLLSLTNFGAGGSTISLSGAGFAVPEPASISIAVAGGLAFLARRRGSLR